MSLRRFVRSCFVLSFAFFAPLASASTFAPSSIAGNTTWDAASGPYIVNSMIDVPSGTTLTILPGTVVKFGIASGATIEGSLVSDGAIFTSTRDDSAGGDTNNDADATAPAPGNWSSIVVNPGGIARIVGGEIRYGGYCCFYFGTFTNQGGEITLDGVTMREHLRDALTQFSGTSTIVRSTIAALGHGAQVTDGTFIIEGNDFEAANAARIMGNVRFDNRGGNHGKDGYRVWPTVSNPLSRDTHWVADGLPYIVQGDATVPAGIALDIDSGAVVKFTSGGSLANLGTLRIGNAVLTSMKDDVILGDTNADGGSTSPGDQDWYGLRNLGR
jgi:hypothetical protein